MSKIRPNLRWTTKTIPVHETIIEFAEENRDEWWGTWPGKFVATVRNEGIARMICDLWNSETSHNCGRCGRELDELCGDCDRIIRTELNNE